MFCGEMDVSMNLLTPWDMIGKSMPKLGSPGNGINVRALYNHVAQSYYDTWLPQYIITPLSLFNKQSTFFRKVKVYIF